MTQDDDEKDTPRGPLIALCVVVILVVVGLWITHVLRGTATLQDCVASGRTNCAPLQQP